MSSKHYEEKRLGVRLDLSIISHLACFVSYEKWVQREKRPLKARLHCLIARVSSAHQGLLSSRNQKLKP